MLARQMHRRALSSSMAVAGPSSIRYLSISSRPSLIALGKRPVSGALPGLIPGSTRNLSWMPWKSTSEPIAESATSTSASAHEPILSSPHPDLQASPSISSDLHSAASTSTSTASDLTSTPIHDLPLSSLTSATDPTPLSSVPTFSDLITNSGLSLPEVLSSHEAVHSVVKVSDLALIGLDHRFINLSGWARDALVSVHTITGLPWWGSIALLTLGLRVCLLPLIVRTQKHNLRLAAVQPEMQALMKKMTEAKAAKDFQNTQLATRELQTLFHVNDVHPLKSLILPLGQMPLFLSMFWGLERLATTPLPQLKEGGFSWVTDLTMSDPYWILPITSVAMTLGVLEVGGADGTGANTKGNQMGHLKNFIRVISVCVVPFVAQMPAAVLFYWTFNNTITLLQAILLKRPTIKRILKIPSPKLEPSNPSDPKINPNPSFRESLDKLREHWNAKAAEYQKMANEKNALDREKSLGLRKGTGMMAEVVNEQSKGGVTSSGWAEAATASSATGAQSSLATTSSSTSSKPRSTRKSSSTSNFLEESSSTSTPTPTLTREQARAKRIEAARERRARQ